MSNIISTDRILSKLDSYFAQNDYIGAENHLKYWLSEAINSNDKKVELLLYNELIGLSRKVGKEAQAIEFSSLALSLLKELGIEESVGAATTYINIATAYKAFKKATLSIPLFEKACSIYEHELEAYDSRLGGLYNNFALALTDLERFKEAHNYYNKALNVMSSVKGGELESAITYLNIASLYEIEFGLVDADEKILECLNKAQQLLDIQKYSHDGYYAFVCEKCASVFGYYGHFYYEKELTERANSIYERS